MFNLSFGKTSSYAFCSKSRAKAPFSLIHADVWGPYHTPNRDGSRFFLTLVDDFSRATWIFLMQSKGQVLSHIRNFFSFSKNQFGKSIQHIRTDNGREFFNSECAFFFSSNGILHENSCTYTPQQNGIVERKHRHLLEVARALKFQASIPETFWGDCVVTAAYLINQMPSRILNKKTPFEMLYGKKPELQHLRVFGCLCYVTTVGPRDKLSPRAMQCIFMGYPSLTKGYRVFDKSTGEFFVSRDVVFHEAIFPFGDDLSLHDESDKGVNNHRFLSEEDLSSGQSYIIAPSSHLPQGIISSPTVAVDTSATLNEEEHNLSSTTASPVSNEETQVSSNQHHRIICHGVLDVLRVRPHGQRTMFVQLQVLKVLVTLSPHMSLFISYPRIICAVLVVCLRK